MPGPPGRVKLQWNGVTHYVHGDVAALLDYHQGRANKAEKALEGHRATCRSQAGVIDRQDKEIEKERARRIEAEAYHQAASKMIQELMVAGERLEADLETAERRLEEVERETSNGSLVDVCNKWLRHLRYPELTETRWQDIRQAINDIGEAWQNAEQAIRDDDQKVLRRKHRREFAEQIIELLTKWDGVMCHPRRQEEIRTLADDEGEETT